MLSTSSDSTSPVTIFYSYSHEDEEYRQSLENHLSLLRRQGIISDWHNRQVVVGDDVEQDISIHLNAASIILLLISSDYIVSDYCFSTEMQCALERQATGKARVIPIILRSVDYWHGVPFADLQCLPHNGKPVTLWPDRDEAFRDIAQSIRAIVAELRGSLFSVHQSTLAQKAMKPRSMTREEKNRQSFLTTIRKTWITRVLQPSLASMPLIVPQLREQPQTLANSPSPMQVSESSVQSLPSGLHITQVYDDSVNELLILGNPGAGKTILLLELTRELLIRAEQDATYPMPVVFNLSSWAQKRMPLSLWLIEELEKRYDIPPAIATEWIHTEQITLLLDGLDEVSGAHRRACIHAINAYRHEYTYVPVVVCSRTDDYIAQKTLLALNKSVSVEPLTPEQIDAYLANTEGHVEAIRLALRNDSQLQELVTSPLMLHVLFQSYQGKSLDDLLATSLEKRQKVIFETYIERMLSHEKANTPSTKEQAKYWLRWLARQMQYHGQTIFYIEQMQPAWLPGMKLLRIYTYFALILPDLILGAWMSLIITYLFFRTFMDLSSDLRYGILGALAGGLLSSRQQELSALIHHTPSSREYFRRTFLQRGALIGSLIVGLSYGLLIGLYNQSFSIGCFYSLGFGGASYLLCLCLFNKQWTGTYPGLHIQWWEKLWSNFLSYKHVNAGLMIGLCITLGYVVSAELVHQFRNTQSVVIAYALSYFLIYSQAGILLSLFIERRKALIQPTEVVTWSWKNFLYTFNNVGHVKNALLIGLFSGLLTALSAWFRGPSGPGPGYGLSVGGTISLFYWLFQGVSKGVLSNSLDEDHRLMPNQGIWYSARNSLVIGFISAFASWWLYYLNNIVYRLPRYLGSLSWIIWTTIWSATLVQIGIYTLLIALGIGFIGAFISGGLACLQHYILRVLLWRAGYIPRNYPQFLDYADRHILLRKVGGGYMFIHRLLLEYLAFSETDTQDETD